MSATRESLESWELIPLGHKYPSECTAKDTPTKLKDVGLNKDKIIGVFAALLIPGRGEPVKDQAILCSRKTGKIIYVGSPSRIPPKHYNVHLENVPVVMPGMWECHAHFMGASPNKPIDSENLAMTNTAEAGARNARAIKDTLYAGFTSAVELGGYATELQGVVEEGSILGPTLYGAGGAISMTGGHGDVFEIPYGSVHQKLSVNAPGTDAGTVVMLQADGIDECRKAVRLNLRRGARLIKIFASGGIVSRDDSPRYQQLSDDELKVIVQEAERMGMICAAHAEGKAGIMASIRAGVKVIQHGSGADEEVFEAMKKNNVMLVATITRLQAILENEDKYPPAMYRKTVELAKMHKAAYRNAVKAGVKCALGSDLFGGPGTVQAAGINGNEIALAVSVGGMTTLQAIEAATANGPLTLGPQGPKSGILKEGYDADLLGLDADPLHDIEMLRKPKNIKYIWKQSKLVKAPGLDPWDVLDR